ncbi:alanyl-tRNA editing protein [Candidatus Woesearchaeota archaeon]|nr:alanyl-tRNA editing protein [Candidatus Woesearchaeota archaeon]
MTEALYLKDSYLKEFEATVIKVEGKLIVLNQTAFYPTSGGQPHDTGIIIADKEYRVVDVRKKEGDIVHYVDSDGLKEGIKIKGVIDWERRYKHMRMHTSAHVISKVIYDAIGALCSGNEISQDETRMDFSVPISREQFEVFAKSANDVLAKDLLLKAQFLPREEAMKIPEVCRLFGTTVPNIPVLRILSIGDFDTEADGGTHVKSTKEVGQIVISGYENKGKERKRIYWKLS